MAMASSGTDPLARLQAGSKELRAERELCQVAAEKGFSTESGADTSTVGAVCTCLFWGGFRMVRRSGP